MINFNPRKRVFDKCTVLIVVEKGHFTNDLW